MECLSETKTPSPSFMCSLFPREDVIYIQSTLVISKSKRLSEILRDIRTSAYQICRIEEKINRTTIFYKCICNLTPEIRDTLKILWKRGEIAPGEQFLLFSTTFFTCCKIFMFRQG